MQHGEEKFLYKDFKCEAEYQYDDNTFYPIKISVDVPINNGVECRSFVFTKVTLNSKDECVDFLFSEAQKYIDKDFEVKE